MRHWKILLVALICLLLLPSPGKDLGKLRPAETLYVYSEERTICLETDLGDKGTGETFQKALQNLYETAPGTLFLDTVQILLIGEESKYLLADLRNLLRPNVCVCVMKGDGELKTATVYLRTHKPKTELRNAMCKEELQELTWDGERFEIAGK